MASNPGLDSEYKTLPLPAGAAQRIVAEFVRTDSRRTAPGFTLQIKLRSKFIAQRTDYFVTIENY
jgi:hypothetical protein